MTDEDRRRTIRRIVLVGPTLGALSAVVVAILGHGGRVGFVVMLMGVAVGSLMAAFVGTIGAIVDEVRRARVSRRRVALVLSNYAAAAFIVVALGSLPGT
ncbi:MAG: hypothetical protein WD576_03915 [Nitriliruptoraceae bacterium]